MQCLVRQANTTSTTDRETGLHGVLGFGVWSLVFEILTFGTCWKAKVAKAFSVEAEGSWFDKA